MSIHRKHIIKLAALAIAISAALPALAEETIVTVTKGNHHYTYYRDHDIYFSPERKTYYWMDNGTWRSGATLSPENQRYISAGGIDIELDTMKPYERNDYVVTHYKNGGPATQQTTTTEHTTHADGATTTTTTTTTKYKYVYYGDHDIYFAPERKTYYWMANGTWQSGTVLPSEARAYVRGGGVAIELDTEHPYERNEYVRAHYRHDRDRHDRDDHEHDDDDD